MEGAIELEKNSCSGGEHMLLYKCSVAFGRLYPAQRSCQRTQSAALNTDARHVVFRYLDWCGLDQQTITGRHSWNESSGERGTQQPSARKCCWISSPMDPSITYSL